MRGTGDFDAGVAQADALRRSHFLHVRKIIIAARKPVYALRLRHAGFVERRVIRVRVFVAEQINYATREIARLHLFHVALNIRHRVDKTVAPVIDVATIARGVRARRVEVHVRRGISDHVSDAHHGRRARWHIYSIRVRMQTRVGEHLVGASDHGVALHKLRAARMRSNHDALEIRKTCAIGKLRDDAVKRFK